MKKIEDIYEPHKIVTIDDNYTKEETYYDKNSIHKILGQINDEVQYYRIEYHNMPQLILISKEIEILFNMEMSMMNQRQMIMLNNEPLELHYVFGIPTITTPVLKGLDYEVR